MLPVGSPGADSDLLSHYTIIELAEDGSYKHTPYGTFFEKELEPILAAFDDLLKTLQVGLNFNSRLGCQALHDKIVIPVFFLFVHNRACSCPPTKKPIACIWRITAMCLPFATCTEQCFKTPRSQLLLTSPEVIVFPSQF